MKIIFLFIIAYLYVKIIVLIFKFVISKHVCIKNVFYTYHLKYTNINTICSYINYLIFFFIK